MFEMLMLKIIQKIVPAWDTHMRGFIKAINRFREIQHVA